MAIVLAVMFLLMAIGTSALMAASTAVGASVNQRDYDQLSLYADSVFKVFSESLNTDEKDFDNPHYLGTKLLIALYKSVDEGNKLPTELGLSFENFQVPSDLTVAIQLEFPDVRVNITPGMEKIEAEGIEIAPWVPKSATINSTMVVTVKAEYKDKALTTVSNYRLTDGYMEEKSETDKKMTVRNSGNWRLVSHENIDYQS